jgi:hypothetical protein
MKRTLYRSLKISSVLRNLTCSLGGVITRISRSKEVRQHLKFYPNNSIYELSDFLSLCRIQICKDKREHSISALRKSIVLDHLLTHVKWGSTVAQMVSIIPMMIQRKKPLNTLINWFDFQFLVSELDTSVTRSNDWEPLCGQ